MNKELRQMSTMNFKRLYISFLKLEKEGTCDVPLTECLNYWIWKTNLVEKTQDTFNQNQYAGLFFVRVLKAGNPEVEESVCELTRLLMDNHGIFIPHLDSSSFIHNGPDFRRLVDILDGIQQYWKKLLTLNVTWAEHLLVSCTILLEPFFSYTNIPEEQANMSDAFESDGGKLQLNTVVIKSLLSKLCCMYRSIFLEQYAIEPENQDDFVPPVENFHVEAAIDTFFKIEMAFSLKIGQYVEYQNTFTEYFNHISQVVYRHTPDYKRPVPPTLQNILDDKNCPVTYLPSFNQLYPQVEFTHEDVEFLEVPNSKNDDEMQSVDLEKWRWLILAGMVYLVNLESGKTFKSKNLSNLMQIVVDLYA